MGNCRWRGGVVGLAGYFISFSSSFAQGILYAAIHQPSAWNINQKSAVWDINLALDAATRQVRRIGAPSSGNECGPLGFGAG
jgi:hypothetical protein